MNKILPIFITLTLYVGCAYSQNMVFDWAKSYEATGGKNQIFTESFAADSNHLFTAGIVLSADNDFDPDTGTYNLSAPYYNSAHISMFDLDGKHVWSKIIGCAKEASFVHLHLIHDIAVNKSGDLYVAGAFQDTLFYETGSGRQFLVSKGYTDIFFGKLDTSGNWLWMKQYGGIYDEHAGGLSIANNGDIYLSGSYADSVAFIPGSTPEYASFYEMFTLKLNSKDQEQWVYSTTNPASYPVFSVSSTTVDNEGAIYIGGNYYGYDGDSVNFQSAGKNALLENNTRSDGFLLKLDTAGNFNWVNRYGSASDDFVDKLSFNAANNSLVVSGRAGSNAIDFDTTTTADSLHFQSGLYGNYLLCISQNGQFRWLKQLFADNAVGTGLITYITTDSKGHIHGLSTFDSPVDADPGTGTVMYAKRPGGASFNSYSLELDSLGNYLWSYHYVTAGNGDVAHGFGKDPYDNIYIGLFDGVGASPDTLTLGNIDIIHPVAATHIAKLRACSNPTVTTVNDSTLRATYLNSSYQWLDCNKGYAPITGATKRTFTASVSGSYALESDSYGCGKDTSKCYQLTFGNPTGNTNYNSTDIVSVFPNPTVDKITVTLPEKKQVVACKVSNVLGQVIYTKNFREVSQFQITLPAAPGMYFIECNLGNNQRVVKKVIKE